MIVRPGIFLLMLGFLYCRAGHANSLPYPTGARAAQGPQAQRCGIQSLQGQPYMRRPGANSNLLVKAEFAPVNVTSLSCSPDSFGIWSIHLIPIL